jgi:hypothetical protein
LFAVSACAHCFSNAATAFSVSPDEPSALEIVALLSARTPKTQQAIAIFMVILPIVMFSMSSE